MKELVLATGNSHKLVELQQLLKAFAGWKVCNPEVVGGMPEVEESAPDFHGNARLKAEALRSLAGPRAVLADDSGLCVEVLGGEPGVHSARYAGLQSNDRANIEKLLRALEGIEPERRRAYFRCVLCFWDIDAEEPRYFVGEVHGRIVESPRGDAGFGYDPVFVPDGYPETFAELGSLIKNQLSHRARALRALVDYLSQG